MDVLHTMKNISSVVSETLSKSLVSDCCKNSDINFEDYVNKSDSLLGHFPKFEEIYQMSTIPSLWSDLFSIECSMLCNKLFLETNIEIAKLMSSHVSKGTVDSQYSRRMDLLTRIQNLSDSSTYAHSDDSSKYDDKNKRSSSLEDTGNFQVHFSRGLNDSLDFSEGLSTSHSLSNKNRPVLSIYGNTNMTIGNYQDKSNLDPSVISTLFSIISNLSVYNDRLSSTCSEDRDFYKKSCQRLFYLPEKELMKTPKFIQVGREKVLNFLKELSHSLDIDKCTLNLSILFFDYYMHLCTLNCTNGSPSTSSYGGSGRSRLSDTESHSSADRITFKDNEMLKIGTSCYLLAGALREHWVDINKDKYLEHAVEMSYNAFTTKDVISVQLDIIHRMPKGFTSVYTCLEYGLFFLANIKYINRDFNTSPGSSGQDKIDYFDDFLFLSSAFNFLTKTGALAWVYHCITKWEELYISKNWNRFIPPSRFAAILVFHIFVTFFKIDFEKDLVWCRRFSHRVFRMFFDTDVALWYNVFKEIIKRFLQRIERNTSRMHEMSSLFSLSSAVFTAIEAIISVYQTRVILEYFFNFNTSAKNSKRGSDKSTSSKMKRTSSNSLDKSRLAALSKSKLDRLSKSLSIDLDLKKTNKMFGLDYNQISILIPNLIQLVQK